jgi:hypothetical protein
MNLLCGVRDHIVDAKGTVLWTSSVGLRCIVVPFYGHCQLRLLRDLATVRTEVFTREADAVNAAKKWRRLYAKPRSRRSHASR